MRLLNKWLKELYLAKKDPGLELDEFGNDKVVYSTPIKYHVNYQPTNGSSKMEGFGLVEKQYQRAVVDRVDFQNVFNEDDLVYLDGARPDVRPIWEKDSSLMTEPSNGAWANYRVDSVREQNILIIIYFERLVGR